MSDHHNPQQMKQWTEENSTSKCENQKKTTSQWWDQDKAAENQTSYIISGRLRD